MGWWGNRRIRHEAAPVKSLWPACRVGRHAATLTQLVAQGNGTPGDQDGSPALNPARHTACAARLRLRIAFILSQPPLFFRISGDGGDRALPDNSPAGNPAVDTRGTAGHLPRR